MAESNGGTNQQENRSDDENEQLFEADDVDWNEFAGFLFGPYFVNGRRQFRTINLEDFEMDDLQNIQNLELIRQR